MASKRTDSKPWFTQPLVWMLIAIPFTAVIMGVILINLAISSEDGLVVDDYYKYGKEINRVLKRDRAAAKLGLNAVLSVAPDKGTVLLSINESLKEGPAALKLRMLHATRQGYDQIISLARTTDGAYQGKLEKPMAPGNWKLELGTKNWRITGRMRAPQQYSVRLEPPV